MTVCPYRSGDDDDEEKRRDDARDAVQYDHSDRGRGARPQGVLLAGCAGRPGVIVAVVLGVAAGDADEELLVRCQRGEVALLARGGAGVGRRVDCKLVHGVVVAGDIAVVAGGAVEDGGRGLSAAIYIV